MRGAHTAVRAALEYVCVYTMEMCVYKPTKALVDVYV
jgi:hypothetical protein